ncbi:MAG TPA: hypothetical protein VGO29_07620 [Solirubrobacteraceae bacterium]|jgi:hypothetical protein|nr:hypothetical protein [Solirubrobacteraceae bacterium]
MKTHARAALAGLLTVASFALLAPAAQAAFGVTESHFEAGTCSVPECEYSSLKNLFYTQAAGHPERGITSVELNSKPSGLGHEPEGSLKRLRVDVPPGLAANPEALPKCSAAAFNSDACPLSTKVGETKLKVFVLAADAEVTGQVYNLEPSPGLPLEFGIHVEVGLGPGKLANEHIFLEGHVNWSGDYHEWFEIDNISKTLPVLKSKLLFDGRAGIGNFLTLPSVCSTSTTSRVEVESYAGEISRTDTHTPVGVENCGAVPFKPTTSVIPEANSASSDKPDGATTVVKVPQNAGPGEINTADIKDAHVTLPEGLTLNPSAAHGLAACSAAQIGIGTTNKVDCPLASRVGTVTIETDLPPGSLAGNVYLGSPGGGFITDPPYTIYLVANATGVDPKSGLEGVSVRLQGSVAPNPQTGRLEVTFANNPQLPFSELRLTVNGGEHAPLANPLGCSGVTDFAFTAYTGAATNGSTPFQASGCPGSPPFSLGQSTIDSSSKAGAYTNYTFNLTRNEGQQYLSRLTSTLPAGLVGEIPSVPLCGEPQAAQGTCPSASQIGTANVNAGSGDPYGFSGPVYLTGPFNGAPYGLSIPVEALAGPFDLGRLVTRVSIGVDPHSARVIAASTLPTIFKGVPLRLRNISVLVNRPNFLLNPTNCGPLSTDSALTSTLNVGQNVSSPFSVNSCSALAFKPKFEAATSASTNPTTVKANGASLRVNLLQGAHEANIHSVVASLPKQLPSRLTTLQKACPEATYAANPFACPPGSKVGSATVTTPVLPGHLTGPAYLVSHGGAAFPDLDLLLEGDGVRVILNGNTQIKNGITTSTFGSIPDVPVTSFVLDLPQGPNSALAANGGSFCTQTLTMPTTITAQSGAVIKQNTNLAVAGCTGKRARIKILSKKIAHNKLVLRVQTFAPGRVSVKSRFLRTTYKRLGKAGKFTIKVPLSRKGVKAQSAHRLKFKARVGFLPKSKAEAISAVFTSVGFKHKSKGGKHRH